MSDLSSLPIFFLGANTATGYVSRFTDCFDIRSGWRVWVLKGGPGSGKSTFMKKAAERLMESGEELFLAPCPADPNSLDAVVCSSRKLMILDGTAPHPLDPPLPGAAGMLIDTGRFWKAEKLAENREKIGALSSENTRLHTRAAGYTAAAARLLSESRAMALSATDIKKAEDFGTSLASRLIPKGGGEAAEQVRFLSGITPAGVVYYRSSVQKLCPKVVEIWDDTGAAAGIVLSSVRREALQRGQRVINCRCPLRPLDKTDHLLLPDLGLAFCSVNRYLSSSPSDRRHIHAQRFTDKEKLARHKNHLNFNRKAAKELLDCAAGILADAKSVHDLLEQYYAEAMDFAALDSYCNALLSEI